MGVNIQTIKDIRFYIAKELDEIYGEQELSAHSNIIIKTVTGFTRLHQLQNSEQAVTSEQTAKIIEICNELKKGRPLQYILGETEFYDCIIKLNNATLIPRPETEELVHLIINENKGYQGEIVDFGTGSGCIAIALAANIPGSIITGIDISNEALTIARDNAHLNKVNIRFITGDIFNFNYTTVGRAGIIVSNPPYVRNSEKLLMSKNVLGFEPHQALFVDDSEPLVYYKAILNIAEKILIPVGRLYFEINEAMGSEMVKLLSSFEYSDIHLIADINSRDRIIIGTKHV